MATNKISRQVERRKYFEAAIRMVNAVNLHLAYKRGSNPQVVGLPRAERRRLARAYGARRWNDARWARTAA